jgi:DNA-binding XRE family transcriptional regulator
MGFQKFSEQVEARARAEGPEATAELALLRARYRVGRQVAQKRLELGLTQEQLAERAAVSQADISRIECGYANPTLSTITALACALSLEVCLNESRETVLVHA